MSTNGADPFTGNEAPLNIPCCVFNLTGRTQPLSGFADDGVNANRAKSTAVAASEAGGPQIARRG